jgi:hypothetical protein
MDPQHCLLTSVRCGSKEAKFSTPFLVVNSFCVLLVLADIEVRVEVFGQPEVRTPDKKKSKVKNCFQTCRYGTSFSSFIVIQRH